MYSINSPDYSDLIQWASEISEVMAQRNRSDIVDSIKQYIEQLQNDNFTISVIGKAKRGKSTLINALMGRHDDTLAPIDKLTATSVITRFQWGETKKAEVFFKDKRTESKSIAWKDICNYVTEEKNPANRKGVSTVIVSGPINGLENHIELVDTPGAGSVHEYHDALLHAFIPQSDAVIFIVTARMPLDNDELELLREVKKADISKIFFIINRVDEIEDPEDLQNAISHNLALLEQNGIQIEKQFYKLSAKQAYLGQSGSGIELLIDALQEFLKTERAQIMRRRFISRVCSVIEPELQSLAITIDSLKKSSEQIDAEIQSFHEQVTQKEEQRKTAEREFSLNWANAVSELQRGVSQTEREVKERLYKEIESHSVLGVSSLCKKLPTILVQVIESGLQDVTSTFEQQAQNICKKLQISYPYIELGEMSRPNLKVGGNQGAWVTTALGTTAAVGGVSFVSVGSATATSIATANAAAIAAANAASAAAATVATESAVAAAGSSSFISGLIGTAGSLFGCESLATSVLTMLGMGGAPTIVVAPTAAVTTATPLWVALSGPVGWSIAGIGLLAIPFAWSISKNRQKDKLQEAAEKKIQEMFIIIRDERIPKLKEMGNSILLSYQNGLDNSIAELEKILNTAKRNRPTQSEISKMKAQCERLNKLIEQVK